MTREDILEAAAQVFRQKGFHGASMSDIAAAVSLQKASLYHHVSSKQEILLELLERALELLLERISLSLESDGLTVLVPRYLPPNDGGLALGQLYLAIAAQADNQAHGE